MRFAIVFALLAGAVAGCGSNHSSPPAPQRFDAARAFHDLTDQVALGPRPSGSAPNRDLVRLIAGRLRDAGAESVHVQRPWHNVVATIPGSEPGTVVVGAHHDTKGISGFAGANDGASGVAVVLELARVLAADAPLDGPSVSLVLFDAEEARGDRSFEADGTRGSEQYVAYAAHGATQGSPPLADIRSMILFDMVGDCGLAVPREEASDSDLYSQFEDAARAVSGSDSSAPFVGTTATVLDDHIPFLDAGIPAVDLIDFDYGPGPSPGAYWHTTQDTLGHVCPESLDAVGEAAVRVLEG